ncbi:MAG: hypothetical protein J6V04_04050 [Bacteroidales bacterium]|nr:hypothetical protein [Bacteroidales bacterium]
MESILSDKINSCAKDLNLISGSDKIDPSFALDAIVRAYDTYDLLLSIKDDPSIIGTEFLQDGTIENYIMEYSSDSEKFDKCFDLEQINGELQQRLTSLDVALSKAEAAMRDATELHFLAKETFEIWTTKGLFARYKALRRLRKRAGFQLEKNRIGNYVARTFDLMNQARTDFAKIQQLRFKADVSYKIVPDLYSKIDSLLRTIS